MTTCNFILYGNPENDKDVYYAAGFDAPDPLFVIERTGERILLVSDLEYERARKESRVDRVVSSTQLLTNLELKGGLTHNFPAVLTAVLEDQQETTFTVPANFPIALADGLRAKGITLTVKADPFFDERVVKRSDEIEKIRAVEHAVDRVYYELADIFKKTKIVADSLVYEGTTLTSEWVKDVIFKSLYKQQCLPVGTIVAGGDQAVDPHNRGSGPLQPHRFIIVDIFPQHMGHHYWGDMTRTFVIGDVSAAMQKQYDAVRVAQQWACDTLKAGISGNEIHRGIEKSFSEAGFETGPRNGVLQGFFHGTGHGVGLDIHEAPRVSADQPSLAQGTVVTIEPGLYYLDTGGVRIEDLGLVTETGYDNFCTFPKELQRFPG